MDTDPAATTPHAAPPDGTSTRKLVAWATFVGALVAVNYTLNYSVHEDKTEAANSFYHYSTAAGSAFLYIVWLAILLWIVGRRRDLLALRRPRSLGAALGLAVLVVVGAIVANAILDPFLHGGREQGLIPDHWLSSHAGAYAVNWIVVAGLAPVVEEITFRGAGFALIAERFGPWPAVVAIGLLFAAAHGLVQAFPEFAILGGGLAWLRWRVGSVYPGIAVHAAFNSFALASVFF